MIVAEKKPIEEIIDTVKDCQSILVLGCNECVTVCEAGGKKEVGLLASALRMHFLQQGREVNIGERTLERQCDHEYLEEIRDIIDLYETVVSIACGVGVQFTAEKYQTKPVVSRREHPVHGGQRSPGGLVGTLPGLRPVPAGGFRRHLSGFPLRQTDPERALRRIQRRKM